MKQRLKMLGDLSTLCTCCIPVEFCTVLTLPVHMYIYIYIYIGCVGVVSVSTENNDRPEAHQLHQRAPCLSHLGREALREKCK